MSESSFHATGRVYHISNYPLVCEQCQETFDSRNNLFTHLKEKNHYQSKQKPVPHDQVRIIPSQGSHELVGTGYAFRDFNFCEIKYKLSMDHPSEWGCLDTGAGMSLIDNTLYITWNFSQVLTPTDKY